MKVGCITNLCFGRALTTKERERAEVAQNRAKKLLDVDKIILINPDTSLPAGVNDYGVGNLHCKNTADYLGFMKSYAGINSLKMLPQGELRNNNGFYCAYSGSSFTLGSHTIDLEWLTKDEMGKILSEETFNKVVANAGNDKKYVNFENVTGPNSLHYGALREAFINFKNFSTPEIQKMKIEFEQYKKDTGKSPENKVLFDILADENKTRNFQEWSNEIDRELFNDAIVSVEDKNKRIEELKYKNSEKIEFSYFRQYLADKNLANSKKRLNENGIKLFGDCLIGFSADEVWANPKAFESQGNIASADWGLRSLRFSEILDENSESYKVLKQKVSGFAQRYDGIRFDVGWAYVEPIIYSKDAKSLADKYVYDSEINAYRLREKLEGRLIDKIADIVKEVKGNKFDNRDLIFEIEAGPKEFSVYDWNKNSVIEPFKGRTIVQSTAYLNDGYATIEMLENKMGINRDNYVLMVGNHDHITLQALANGVDKNNLLGQSGNDIKKVLEAQYSPLEKDLKLAQGELKRAPQEFVKAKFAQLFLARNIKIFFPDLYGISEQFDSQQNNTAKNYRLRVPSNYEESYHAALQKGQGFNLYESMATAMKAKGLDKADKKLYKSLLKYGRILRKRGALSEKAANEKSKKFMQNLKKSVFAVIALFSASTVFYLYKKTKNHN